MTLQAPGHRASAASRNGPDGCRFAGLHGGLGRSVPTCGWIRIRCRLVKERIGAPQDRALDTRNGVVAVATVSFVSVRHTFDPRMRINDLEPWVSRAWAISVAKVNTADRVVALSEGRAIAARDLRGAFPVEETYTLANGDTRPRVALALGSPLPVLAQYDQPDLNMRRGVA